MSLSSFVSSSRLLQQPLKHGVRELMAVPILLEQRRDISTSSVLEGKRNFRKFHLGNKRGTRMHRQMRNEGKFPDMPVETSVQPIGFKYGNVHHTVQEMVPEFIVPDLTGCELKPYVSYKAGDIYQEEFTPKDLFEHVYLPKLNKDYKEGKLDAEGNPLEPSPEERVVPDEAWIQARKTGSDIFSERIPRLWECLEIDMEQWKKDRAAKHGYEHFSDFLKEPYSQEDEAKEEDDKKPKIVPNIKHRPFF